MNTIEATRITIILADNHPLILAGVRATLMAEEDMRVVGEATNTDEVQQLVNELEPDVLILDLNLPGRPTSATIAHIRQSNPRTQIIMLTAFDDYSIISGCVSLGVTGYIIKGDDPKKIVRAVHSVIQGGMWFSQCILEKLVTMISVGIPQGSDISISQRERHLLNLISKGWSNNKISSAMCLESQTIRNYVSRLYATIGVNTRAEAIIWARDHGFTEGHNSDIPDREPSQDLHTCTW